jgi:hypothetical protein
MYPAQPWPAPPAGAVPLEPDDEADNSHRPPNAFILYSQAMRSSCRQDNPSLSNTEVSRLLGKMWKDVSSDVKVQYKQKAALAQEQFKRDHPNYTYRKARKKRALNELLAKSAQGFPMPGFPPDANIAGAIAAGAAPYMMQMYGQAGQMMPGQPIGGVGMVGQPGQLPQGFGGYPGMAPGQQALYQYPPK